MAPENSQALLARLQRTTLVACGAIAVVALVLDPQRPRAAIGVLGGGLLIAISYAAVAFTIGAFIPAGRDADAPKRKQKRVLAAVIFAGHYALLAFVAYVMIARLRLHPIGLLGGVTSLVVAVAAEAVRSRGRG